MSGAFFGVEGVWIPRLRKTGLKMFIWGDSKLRRPHPDTSSTLFSVFLSLIPSLVCSIHSFGNSLLFYILFPTTCVLFSRCARCGFYWRRWASRVSRLLRCLRCQQKNMRRPRVRQKTPCSPRQVTRHRRRRSSFSLNITHIRQPRHLVQPRRPPSLFSPTIIHPLQRHRLVQPRKRRSHFSLKTILPRLVQPQRRLSPFSLIIIQPQRLVQLQKRPTPSLSNPAKSNQTPCTTMTTKTSKPKPASPSQPSHTQCVNSPTDRQCWGEFDINTNYYEVTPDTGRTVEVHHILFRN
jgi:hypothetical protein